MKKIPFSILCGLAAVLVTIILYFTILGNIFVQAICLITLLGVLLAEVVVTFLAYRSKGIPGKVAATMVSAAMIPFSVAISVVYIVNFPFGYGSYLGYYFAVFAILLTISAIIWKFADGIQEKNDTFQNAKQNMLDMRKIVKSIMADPNAEKYGKELSALEEKLHFSNDAVIAAADSEISDMLTNLKNNIGKENFDAASCIADIVKKIDLRNISVNKNV